jgi:antitoxin ParD1/3/4
LPFSAIRHILPHMDSMNISIPEKLKTYVDAQVDQGGYSSASEYIRELIRADEKAKAQAKLEALLFEGLVGETTPWTEADSQRLLALAATGR